VADSKFKTWGAIMPINHHEIIEDMEAHIRKCGGAWEEWCVGTAKDSRGPFFQRHREADLGDGLTYREAFTTDAAQAVVAHLVNDRGLQLHSDGANEDEGHWAPARPEAERHSARQSPEAERRSALQEPGKIVFVYRKTPPATAAAGSEHPTFHKLAA
jgi:hypothetical protein